MTLNQADLHLKVLNGYFDSHLAYTPYIPSFPENRLLSALPLSLKSGTDFLFLQLPPASHNNTHNTDFPEAERKALLCVCSPTLTT